METEIGLFLLSAPKYTELSHNAIKMDKIYSVGIHVDFLIYLSLDFQYFC